MRADALGTRKDHSKAQSGHARPRDHELPRGTEVGDQLPHAVGGAGPGLLDVVQGGAGVVQGIANPAGQLIEVGQAFSWLLLQTISEPLPRPP